MVGALFWVAVLSAPWTRVEIEDPGSIGVVEAAMRAAFVEELESAFRSGGGTCGENCETVRLTFNTRGFLAPGGECGVKGTWAGRSFGSGVPCSSGEWLGLARRLGASFVEEAPLSEPTVALTQSPIPTIETRSPGHLVAPTLLRGPELERALRTYQERRFRLFSDQGSWVVFEGGRSLDDCQILGRLGYGIHPRLARKCDSNVLEWSYALLPVGAGLSVAGFAMNDEESGRDVALLGAALALGGLLVGVMLNRDGMGSEEHALAPEELRGLVEEANLRIAASLGLVALDLEIAARMH